VAVATFVLGAVRAAVSTVRWFVDWLAGRGRGAGDRVRHALTIKAAVAERLPEILSQTNGEVIVREIRRKDTYPDPDDSLRGISPWFKVELKGTYHAGIEVFLSIQSVLISDGVAHPTRDTDNPAVQTVFVVGRIPYSAIEVIDWEGDEYYGFTHIYCRFRPWGRGPYESVLQLYSPRQDAGRTRYELVEGVRWQPKPRRIVARWRDRRFLRKDGMNRASLCSARNFRATLAIAGARRRPRDDDRSWV
jgi:hypothetical protein